MPELLQWVKWCHERCPSMERVMQGFVDPHGDWTPSAEDKSLAWELYVEMRTRISTQPLHFLSDHQVQIICRPSALTTASPPKKNRRHFETPHISEMIYLLLKGLRTVSDRR